MNLLNPPQAMTRIANVISYEKIKTHALLEPIVLGRSFETF